jgi:hypothetical protein
MINPPLGIDPFDDPVDRLLAEIAFSIQLPPSLHQKAVDRYEAVRNHLESTSSVFKDQIEYFYPQGSMSIDATISTKGTDDEYDLDIVAQLGGRFRFMTPLQILIELEKALKGYRGLKVVRQTRCVTLYYQDGMHLDISPSIREEGTQDRQSHICHAKGPSETSADHMVPMNAYGFGEYFRQCTPIEQRVVDSFSKRWEVLNEGQYRADADVDDVPEPTAFVVKNTATLALQIHKRFRNIQYADYKGRIAPSILLSYYAAAAARADTSLTDMVIRQASFMITEIENASLYRRLIDVSNPCHKLDVFTDRWPENIGQQDDYAKKLKELVAGLEQLKRGQMAPISMMEWMRDQFGSQVVTRAADAIANEIGHSIKNSSQQYTRSGKVIIPSAAATAAVVGASKAVAFGRNHTFYGKKI